MSQRFGTTRAERRRSISAWADRLKTTGTSNHRVWRAVGFCDALKSFYDLIVMGDAGLEPTPATSCGGLISNKSD